MKDKSLLAANGWNVITVWECQLKNIVKEMTINALIKQLVDY